MLLSPLPPPLPSLVGTLAGGSDAGMAMNPMAMAMGGGGSKPTGKFGFGLTVQM